MTIEKRTTKLQQNYSNMKLIVLFSVLLFATSLVASESDVITLEPDQLDRLEKGIHLFAFYLWITDQVNGFLKFMLHGVDFVRKLPQY